MALLYKSALFSKVWNYICSNIASRCRNIARKLGRGGDGAGDTNDCQQKPKQSARRRPIRAPEEMSAASRPITATAASSVPQPANFQTAQPVFTNDMFRTRPADPTPDSNVVNSQFRPVRRTRNPNPKYIDAIWSASQDEIDMLNGMINNVRR